jgi:hypothetical protein
MVVVLPFENATLVGPPSTPSSIGTIYLDRYLGSVKGSKRVRIG